MGGLGPIKSTMSWKKKHIKVTGDNGASAAVDRAMGDRAVEPELLEPELDARDADFEDRQEHATEEMASGLDPDSLSSPSEASNQLAEKYKAESAENYDKYLRALAEFENYKKRALKERGDLLKYQGEKILGDMLDVGDNLDFAIQYADADPEKLRDGVKLIHKIFMDVLARWDVRPVSGIGKPFDPITYNAISRVPASDAAPGTIVGELKKAYFYKDKLLRVGEVVVATEADVQDDAKN